MTSLAYYTNGNNYNDGDVTFTMPAAGTVYYSGASSFYPTSTANGVCQIYKNGTLVDSRDGGQGFSYRGTMVNKSFSANAGDVIKIRATIQSRGTVATSFITATMVYYQ